MGIRAQVLDTGHRGQDPLCLLSCTQPVSVQRLCSVYAVRTYGLLVVMHEFFLSFNTFLLHSFYRGLSADAEPT
jgi:hypothetical protein